MAIAAGKIAKAKSDCRWNKSLQGVLKNAEWPIKSLSTEQIKDIKTYYSQFGFKNIKTNWHEYI